MGFVFAVAQKTGQARCLKGRNEIVVVADDFRQVCRTSFGVRCRDQLRTTIQMLKNAIAGQLMAVRPKEVLFVVERKMRQVSHDVKLCLLGRHSLRDILHDSVAIEMEGLPLQWIHHSIAMASSRVSDRT